MSVGVIFITASPDLVDVKLVNWLLFYLHDWEYETEDHFHIQWTRDMPGLEEGIDVPPLLQLSANNDWSPVQIEGVMQFALKSIDLLLILDNKGIEEQIIIVAQRLSRRTVTSESSITSKKCEFLRLTPI